MPEAPKTHAKKPKFTAEGLAAALRSGGQVGRNLEKWAETGDQEDA